MDDVSVIVCAALPPPVVGQSLASKMLVDQLRSRGVDHQIVNLTRPIQGRSNTAALVKRGLQVATFAPRVAWAARKLRWPPVFYHQLSHGRLGMVRDLPLLAHANLRRWPMVLHVHGGGFRTALDTAPAPLAHALRRLLTRTARAVVLEPRLRSMFAGIVADERVVVVPNGAPQDVADLADEPREPPPESAGLHLVFLSNLHEPKGHRTVLECARLAARAGAPHRFTLAGARTDEMVTDPDRFIADHDLKNTTYVGPVHGRQKLDLLASADVFALPSGYAEGQPIAIIEAMHCGIPVIASHRGGMPDMFDPVDPDGDLLIEPDDAPRMLALMNRLVSSPALYRQIASANFDRAKKTYSCEAHGARMVELFREVAELRG